MNETIVFTVSILWLALFFDFILEALNNLKFRQQTMAEVWQKGTEGHEGSNGLFKYLCKLVFVGPIHQIKSTDVFATIDLIRKNHKKKKFKVFTVTVDYRDVQNQRFCCQSGFVVIYLIHRLKPLTAITQFRATNHLTDELSKIFLKGIEIVDQMTGERSYYWIQKQVEDKEMKNAPVHHVKPQRLFFFSRQTFCPDFHDIEYEAYGTTVETPADSPEHIFRVRLLPKLNWLEVIVFRVFLVQTLFALLVSILYILNDDSDGYDLILASTLGSGLIAPTVTQVVGFTYRSVVRTNHDFWCSPLRIERHQSSKMWTTFRFLYLIFLLTISGLFTILVLYFVEEDFKFSIELKKSLEDSDILLLLLLFLMSMVTVYMVWLPIFSLIRFIYRFLVFVPDTAFKSIKTQKTIKSSAEPEPKPEAKRQMKAQKPVEKPEPKDKAKTDRNTSPAPNDRRDEDKDQSDTTDKPYTKLDELMTGSVIVRPTKSLGFIDPETFKLSESRIHITEPEVTANKPKTNQKPQ